MSVFDTERSARMILRSAEDSWILFAPGSRSGTRQAEVCGLAYRCVASPATLTLLPIYNFIDATLFELAILRAFRLFVLTSGKLT
jgi:hypothetical protein